MDMYHKAILVACVHALQEHKCDVQMFILRYGSDGCSIDLVAITKTRNTEIGHIYFERTSNCVNNSRIHKYLQH